MKTGCFILLFCFSGIAFSQSTKTLAKIVTDSRPCLKWRKVCYQKEHCLYREAIRNSCFRCMKPNHYGFHLYPQQIDRNTCHLQTVHYLQTMGYRCFQPYGAQSCGLKRSSQHCHLQCMKYGKENLE